MKFEVYNEGKNNLKVAFFSKNIFKAESSTIIKIAQFNNLEIHLFSSDKNYFSVHNAHNSYKEHLLLDNNEEIREAYDYIYNYIDKNKISISLFFWSGFSWTKKFLDKLKKVSYLACWFADDPEGCETTSKYYVKNFNYAFCGGIYFDKTTRIIEKYKEWGARKSKFIPLGIYPEKYKEVKDYNNRKIELVYVGGCYFPKVFRLFKLKKHFGSRMRMYGRGWNKSNSIIKTLILKIIKFVYNIPQIEELPKNKLVELYQNTKIGFNLHMSYGPSNVRMYELPANGVMQLCDCENGLKELYEINKEVISYKNIKDAIQKIEYYLKNHEERIKVARAGNKRVLKNYKLENSFKLLLDEINSDLIH